MRFCSAQKMASVRESVVRRKVPGPARCQGRRKTVLKPLRTSTCTKANGNPQLEADDTTEPKSVETPLHLEYRLRARHRDSDGVENVWNDKE